MIDLPPCFLSFDRHSWASFRSDAPPGLSASEAWALRGQTEQVTPEEIEAIYMPLARLLTLYVQARESLRRINDQVMPRWPVRGPFMIGIAGSVAAGKSTTSRVLRALLSRLSGHPRVEVVNTDGFLRPTAYLEARGMMHRKGFPDSYDQDLMVAKLGAIKAGEPTVTLPVYSHYHYDIVADGAQVVERPDIVLVEGLNVLQGANRARPEGPFVADLLDFSIYVDAPIDTLRQWYLSRFMLFRAQARGDAKAFFHRFCALSDADAKHFAEQVWGEINERNLTRHILPYRACARLILHKDAQHCVQSIHLRAA